MKSFFKIGSLFALIMAGRYMQLTTPTAAAGLAKTPIQLSTADTATALTLARYVDSHPVTTTTVSEQPADQAVNWF